MTAMGLAMATFILGGGVEKRTGAPPGFTGGSSI